MLNALIDLGMEDANVFGILVKGLAVSTFAMDMKAQVYRMIQLESFTLVSIRSQLGVFPTLFGVLLHVKVNITE
ncbi:hypothetical protein EC973_005891 [Apophysomyces ossiformis]|uniref:Uncharacterized protein n=1 Tax=Apophysomyces ossiformis TaxID=679940 RepID=A0A8H7BEN4_9FUNG|nr:hypothetical protein EC973_005891 [Apophysomyces ossiformis]